MIDIKNPFALRNNRLVTVYDLDPSTERGLNCQCICPLCNGEFEAKMGDIREWHFAHSGKPCNQTILYVNSAYEFVKQCILDYKVLFYPSFFLDGNKVFDSGALCIDSVEIHYKTNGIPSGLVINGNQLAVRLDLKIDYCLEGVQTPLDGLSTIIIDLKEVDKMTSTQIKDLVCNDLRYKHWIYSKRVEIIRKEKEAEKVRRESFFIKKSIPKTRVLPSVACSICNKMVFREDTFQGTKSNACYCFECIKEHKLNWREL